MTSAGGAADRRIGMAIGDYVITEKLAEGGMGAVYVATHRGLKKVVKFVLAEFAQNPAIRERFQRECDAAIRLKGKTNIVEIDSHNERDGEMYLVMEYLQGETLQEHLRRCGTISVRHAFRLIAQIAAALHELHTVGIIHRDLKPQNVFVVATDTEAYRVKVIDFGIVHDRRAVARGEGKTQRGVLIGTPGYMALEQFGDAGNVTPAADVFALAVIVWEMFCGQLPWSAPNEFALYEKQRAEPPVLPAGHHLPAAWEVIVRAALSPDPASRPPLHAFLYALAREIPSEPPLPDGFQMILRYAPRVLQNTPVEVETVRASDAQLAGGAYWPLQRATLPPATGPNAAWISSDAIPISAAGHEASAAQPRAASHTPATVGARPAVIAPQPTTLGSSAGVVADQPLAPRRGMLALLGIAGAVAAGGLTFGIAHYRARSDGPAVAADAAAGAAGETRVDAGEADAGSPALAEVVDAGTVTLAIDAGVAQPAEPGRTKTTTTKRSTSSTRERPRAPETGSAAPSSRKFDPNAPAGED